MTASTIKKIDDLIAIRYGDVFGEYDVGAPARIGQFVLGHDIDTRITLLNENLTSVVQPISQFWNPDKGIADLIITDPKTGVKFAIGLGDWLVKYPDGTLRPMSDNKAFAAFHVEKKALTFHEELEHLINKHSMESGSDTPDYVLSEYLTAQLRFFNRAVRQRDASKGK